MTLTFAHDLGKIKENQRTKYLAQKSFSGKVIVLTHRHTHTHRTDCSTWTTKAVGQYNMDDDGRCRYCV